MATIYGTSSADSISIIGTAAANTEHLIFANEGNDTVRGGNKRDVIYGWSENDLIYGYDGNDLLTGDQGDDMVYGGAGNDGVYGWSGNDWLQGDAGDDYLAGEQGNDTVGGDDGNDVMFGWTGNDRMLGGAGNDFIGGDQDNDSLYGEAGNDKLFGWTGNDLLVGGAGSDQLAGEDGNDTMAGNDGNDILFGFAGNDLIILDNGSDAAWGGTENDRFLVIGTGADTIFDFTRGQDKIDLRELDVTGIGSGANKIQINGSDIILAGQKILTTTNVRVDASDILFDDAGVVLRSKAATLTGTAFDDFLQGTHDTQRPLAMPIANPQTLNGGAGNDTLQGGVGNDTLTGGAGNDVFLFQPSNEWRYSWLEPDAVRPANMWREVPAYHDVITDFTIGQDSILIQNIWSVRGGIPNDETQNVTFISRSLTANDVSLMISTAVNTSAGVKINMPDFDSSTITLAGLTKTDLTASMFDLG